MAHLFVNDIMGQFYAELPALPRVKEENESNNGIPERTKYKMQVFYLRRWGIIPLGDYNAYMIPIVSAPSWETS